MLFYSTNKKSPNANLRDAVLNGLAPDGGLYMPTEIPTLPATTIQQMDSLSFPDIAYEVGKKLFVGELTEDKLRSIIDEAFNFDVPLVKLDKNFYTLELFGGPTLAFKDFAARFMARLMSYFIEQTSQELTILVATSGDTGSAVAHGFLNVPGIKVIILYPSGKVSNIQEKQLTTMDGNITTLEIKGSFDDCQKLVKQAFLDNDIIKARSLASANSINIARLFPQSFYYFYAYSRVAQKSLPVVISIPSGNFGNLTAGLIAKRMGLPIQKFIASTNINDVVPNYLETGNFKTKPSKETISNAMDIGNPSNFARMLELYNNDVKAMRQDIFGISFSDQETKEAIKEAYKKYDYIMDPHGAVAYLGLNKYRQQLSESFNGIFIETAHPAKFADTVEKVLEIKVGIPKRLKQYLNREKKATLLSNKFKDLKEFLLS
jgi:threonine synthase